MIDGVLVDLDDTLFPQEMWLSGAWKSVAAAAPTSVDAPALVDALHTVASEGTDRGRIIDRALVAVGASSLDVVPLVQAFRQHAPAVLEPYPGVVDALEALRQQFRVALVTDGDVGIQRAKLRALRLEASFDAVVFSDHLGRAFRKPHPAPFRLAAEELGLDPARCVMIGDRPDKDVAGAAAAGLVGAVRVRTGEYAARADRACLAAVDTFAEAAVWVLDAAAAR